MPRPEYITVTAPPGRLTPVHEKDGIDTNGGQLRVTEDHVCRVRYSQTVQRSIGRGDLTPCTATGTPCSIDRADAPADLGVKNSITRPAKVEGKAS